VSKKLKENNDIDSTDIVSALIKAKFNAKADSEENMVSEQEIFEEFSTFMAAGTDTTSIFVAMIIYSIAKNPEI
jgi:cytochrome P450